jgi:hypothetical protein
MRSLALTRRKAEADQAPDAVALIQVKTVNLEYG